LTAGNLWVTADATIDNAMILAGSGGDILVTDDVIVTVNGAITEREGAHHLIDKTLKSHR